MRPFFPLPTDSWLGYNEFILLNRRRTADSILVQDSHLTQNNAAEVIGKVQMDLSIKVLQATDFGTNFGTGSYLPWAYSRSPLLMQWRSDYAAADGVVEATHRYRNIFYESASNA